MFISQRFVTKKKALNKRNEDYHSAIINNSNPSLAERLETPYKTPLFREADYQFQLSISKLQNKNRLMLAERDQMTPQEQLTLQEEIAEQERWIQQRTMALKEQGARQRQQQAWARAQARVAAASQQQNQN